MQTNQDPLISGFFTHSQTARLLGINSRSVATWLNGYGHNRAGPVIDRDYDRESRTVSFLDLMELRFIKYFRTEMVPMQTIRRAANILRQQGNSSHPLATSKAKYLTDRKNIFQQVAVENHDEVTLNLISGQHEIYEALESKLAQGVEFDPVTYLACAWQPNPDKFPNIVVNPKYASGCPTINNCNVPTVALFRQWNAEEQNVGVVARWYNVEESLVDEAVRFELSMAA